MLLLAYLYCDWGGPQLCTRLPTHHSLQSETKVCTQTPLSIPRTSKYILLWEHPVHKIVIRCILKLVKWLASMYIIEPFIASICNDPIDR